MFGRTHGHGTQTDCSPPSFPQRTGHCLTPSRPSPTDENQADSGIMDGQQKRQKETRQQQAAARGRGEERSAGRDNHYNAPTLTLQITVPCALGIITIITIAPLAGAADGSHSNIREAAP